MPERRRAARKASKEPRRATSARTMAVRPAAGPETLRWEPLMAPTTMPPMVPAMMPAMAGTPEAWAMPRQRGMATRKTTRPATRSRETGEVLALAGVMGAEYS